MSRYVMKLPDVGEGVAEAELVEWLVQIGDHVTPDTAIAEVLTDKATVEVSAPVAGEVVALHGEPGDVLAVGGDLIGIETDQAGVESSTPDDGENEAGTLVAADHSNAEALTPSDPPTTDSATMPAARRSPRREGGGPIAAPAVRARAKAMGLDLATIPGSGPDGRVLHQDLDRLVNSVARVHPGAASGLVSASDEGHRIAVRGVRRKIAERLSTAWREIPHITYVEDVDVTELERLRAELNERSSDHGVRLTILPFLARAMVMALADQPELNAHYDHGAETLTTFDAVHIGVATQTDDGLRVPVVRHSEGRGIWGLATEIGRVTAAARDGSATRDELSGSTITITSLGAMGGVVTTPIINPPEVVIVGVNKIETRPAWRNGAFQPRQMMNLSSSFDHRMVDGWDAATFVQRIKRLLETPALLFITDS
ncbi:MAG: 2-oxo acid dehydrogenase subunit E2 [Acidimicrobiales bacterium]|nr:2-oxo acid dehydrogenase subunit E2 [Acidimicrobiales bacterium]